MARVSPGKARFTQIHLPSDQELAITRNREPDVPRRTASGRGDSYSMTAEQAIGAAALMDRTHTVSPLAGLPIAASSGDFAFARAVMGRATGEDGLWDDFWLDDQSGYDYKNLAEARVITNPAEANYMGKGAGSVMGGAVTSGPGRQPAPISLVPTSTTNPNRPRTVAAGYDSGRQVLTVVFRDGTFYNYYEVPVEMWEDFKEEHSKGEFIRVWLDAHARGAANMAKNPTFAREQLYRVARTGQLVNDGQPELQHDRTRPPRLDPTRSRGTGGKAPKPNNSASRPKQNGMKRSK